MFRARYYKLLMLIAVLCWNEGQLRASEIEFRNDSGSLSYATFGGDLGAELRLVEKGRQETWTTGINPWVPPSKIAFLCRYSYQDSVLNTFPTYRYIGAVEVYLELTPNPYVVSKTPELFIEVLKERNQHFLVRNGDAMALRSHYQSYLENLNRLKSLTSGLGVPLTANRKVFSNEKGDQLCDWSLVKQMRRALWKSFRKLKRSMQAAYETEVLLLSQYLHNHCLFEAVNTLTNLDGAPLPTYVYSKHRLFQDQPQLSHLNGIVVLGCQNGLFSSDTPAIRRDYPDLIGKAGSLAVFVEAGAPAAILSHEYGHLYYLFHHWETYTAYMKSMGSRYQVGGHGIGDLSGEAAELAEAGKMPDLHMAWQHRMLWRLSRDHTVSMENLKSGDLSKQKETEKP